MGQAVSPTEQRGCGPGHTVCGLEEVESPRGKHRQRETESSQRGARKAQWGFYGAYGRKRISWALFLAKPVIFKNSIYFEKTLNIQKSCKNIHRTPDSMSFTQIHQLLIFLPRLLYHPLPPTLRCPYMISFPEPLRANYRSSPTLPLKTLNFLRIRAFFCMTSVQLITEFINNFTVIQGQANFCL